MSARVKIAAVAAAAAVMSTGCAAANQKWHSGCRVLAKDTLTEVHGSNGNTSTKRTNRLSTSCGPFNVVDAWAAGVTESWDLWQSLQVGKTYDIKTGGFRLGLLSEFPSVIEVREVR